ncbi:A disintegrin and metalloproteinase with thrombospondin motifs 17, partial [Ophiophagus hannah]
MQSPGVWIDSEVHRDNKQRMLDKVLSNQDLGTDAIDHSQRSLGAVAELAVVIPEEVPLNRVHFLQPPKSGPNKAQRRRSVPLPEDAAQLLIRLPVGAGLPPTSDVYLMLHHDDRFLAPGFSVEEIDENRSMRHHQAVDQLCFYTGHVLNRSHDSLASLSTCGGLTLPVLSLPVASALFALWDKKLCGVYFGKMTALKNRDLCSALGEHLQPDNGIPAAP